MHTHTLLFLKIKYLEKIKNSEQELEVGMAGESLHGQFIPQATESESLAGPSNLLMLQQDVIHKVHTQEFHSLAQEMAHQAKNACCTSLITWVQSPGPP